MARTTKFSNDFGDVLRKVRKDIESQKRPKSYNRKGFRINKRGNHPYNAPAPYEPKDAWADVIDPS